MTPPRTEDLDEPTAAESAFVKLWGDVDDQVEVLNQQIDELCASPEAVGNKPLIFFVQGINASSATLLLLKNGFFEPAAATARLALENLFCAAACNEDSTYFEQLERADEFGMRQWAKAMEPNEWQLEDSSSPTQRDRRDYRQIAEDGKLSFLYEENYKYLSKSGAHANTLAPMLRASTAGGPLPEFNLMVGVLRNLEICLTNFARLWERLAASRA